MWNPILHRMVSRAIRNHVTNRQEADARDWLAEQRKCPNWLDNIKFYTWEAFYCVAYALSILMAMVLALIVFVGVSAAAFDLVFDLASDGRRP